MKNNFLLIIAALLLVSTIIISGLAMMGWDASKPFPYTIFQHDNNWFGTIVTGGYWVRIPPEIVNSPDLLNIPYDVKYQSNIAFSPGYPLTAKGLYHLTGISAEWSLLLVSWFFAVVFWTYFWKILIEYQIPLRFIILSTLSVALFPGGFFLVVGYSESMYLSGFLMFFYYALKKQEQFSITQAACGALLMTTTRVALALITFVPFFYTLVSSWLSRRVMFSQLAKVFLVGVVGALGAVGFLLFGEIAFGSWRHYMAAQQLGWTSMVHTNFLLLEKTWLFESEGIKRLLAGDYESDTVSNFIAHLYWYFALSVPILDMTVSRSFKKFFTSPRFAFYCVTFILTAFYCSAVIDVRYHSMTRYLLLVHTSYIIATMLLIQALTVAGRTKTAMLYTIVVALSLIPSGYLFSILFSRYLETFWVA